MTKCDASGTHIDDWPAATRPSNAQRKLACPKCGKAITMVEVARGVGGTGWRIPVHNAYAPTPPKVLTIRPVWAWLIVRPDLQGEARAQAVRANVLKSIENRTRMTKHRGELYIHAGAKHTRADLNAARALVATFHDPRISVPDDLDQIATGGIIGRCVVTDCVPPSRRENRWHVEGWGWVLGQCEALPWTPAEGRLGLWNMTDDLLDRIKHAQANARRIAA